MVQKKLNLVFWYHPSGDNVRFMIQCSVAKSDILEFNNIVKKHLSGWSLTGKGYDPIEDKRIFIYTDVFTSTEDWDEFILNTHLSEITNMKEIE